MRTLKFFKGTDGRLRILVKTNDSWAGISYGRDFQEVVTFIIPPKREVSAQEILNEVEIDNILKGGDEDGKYN